VTGALEAVRGIVDSGGESDDILRRVVETLVESGTATWAGILFAERGELVLGPEAGRPTGEGRLQVPVVYSGTSVAELATEGCDDGALLEAVAALLPEHCLVGWDTGGAPWEP
jgi:putative methionine-R-sulfoxide reductase with GAF domain